MYDRYYEPTTEDLKDWTLYLMSKEEEDFYDYGPSEEQQISWNEENDYRDEEDNDPDPGEMDGDAQSAFTSIGWGTDEDYGYYGDFDNEN